MEITASVDASTPKGYWVEWDNFESAIKSLKTYTWAAPLVASLEAKAASLPAEEEEA